MTDRLAEQGALQYAVENLAAAGTNPNRLGLAGYIHAAYTDYQTWAAANPGVNPNRLSARGRIYGYFYDNAGVTNPDAVIEALFANSEQGAWYDPSDMTTMFQDSAGITPVTEVGQSVGKLLDKSGNGNHAIQSVSGARPVLQVDANGCYYLAGDGISKRLSTVDPVQMSSSAHATAWYGAYKASDASAALFAELSADVTSNNGSFGLFFPLVGNGDFAYWYRSTTAVSTGNTAVPAPIMLYGTLKMNGVAGTLDSRINGTQLGTISGAGAASFGNHRLHLMSRNDTQFFFNGRMYSFILRGGESTQEEIEDVENWVKSKTSPIEVATSAAIYNRYDGVDVNGQNVMVLVPNTNSAHPYDMRVSTSSVIISHGSGENQEALLVAPLKTDVRTALLDAGYILGGSNQSGDNWGNQSGVTGLSNLSSYIQSRYNTNGVCVWAQSMGGLSALTAVATGAISNIKGALFTYPCVSLQSIYSSGQFTSSINTAYGITGTSPNTYNEKTSGFDPAIRVGSEYGSLRQRFYASPDDTIIPKAQNTDIIKSLINSYATESAVVVCYGEHGDPSHYQPSDYVSFFDRCFA